MKEPRNPYRDADNRPRLLRSVAAFVDILGYVDLIQSARTLGKEGEILNVLRASLDTAFQSVKITKELWAGAPAPWLLKAFSDNVVIGVPIREHPGLDLNLIAGRLGSLQLQLALQGFFVRGGIAVGDLYLDEEMAYGAALTDAYSTEQSVAVTPRIVLHESAEQAMNAEFKRIESFVPSLPAYNETFAQDADGGAFVNYLSGITEFEYDDRIYFDLLETHKSVVEAKLAEHSTNLKVLAKYLWSAQYHNFFCRELATHASEAERYLITVAAFLPIPSAIQRSP
jgi:hypothetical protein